MSLLFSCESIFDYNSDGRVNYDEVFSYYSMTGYAMNACYNYRPLYTYKKAIYTDEAQDANDVNGSSALKYYQGEMSSIHNYLTGNDYNTLYEGIRKCNVFLKNEGKLDISDYDIPENKSRWRGEAFLLRAYYAWELIKRYGPLPIMKNVIPQDFDFASMQRPSFADAVQSIMDDIDSALAEQGLKWRIIISSESGSVTRSMAYALKSEITLFAASPLWNPDNDISLWQIAARTNKEAIDSLEAHNYGLFNPDKYNYPGCISKYQDYFFTHPELSLNPPTNKEFIWGYNNIKGIWKNCGVPMKKADGVISAGMCPSQELVDAYCTTDGKPILDLSKPYLDDEHLQPNYNSSNSLYDPANPYKNRDPRLSSTIYCNGDNFNLKKNNDPVWTYVGGNSEISTTSVQYTRTGYYLRKYINWTSNKNTDNDGCEERFRMSEVYLNYAEAELEANGVTEEAIKYASKTRLRVGMPVFSDNLSVEEFRQELRNERRVELAFEGHRFYDVRRWKVIDKTEGIVTGMYITQKPDNANNSDSEGYTYKRIIVQKRNITDSKYLIMPIPRTEELKFAKVGREWQNTGW